ncbi:MAG: hypothetical protein FD123_3794 [Bacteroidetes bacterium]|nr:MAG: hypothetical protein FD123_3794 [Bacteroidota bacterium]
MKKSTLLFSSVLLIAALAFSSCGDAKKPDPAPDSMMKKNDSTAQASAYVCPMGPECGKGDAPGKCAGCGMDLVASKK